MPAPEAVFVPPEDENARIWRYMDFPRFVSFLISKSLYFSRSDLLGDPYEASYPSINKDMRERVVDELISRISNNKLPADWKDTVLTTISNTNRFLAKSMFVNCWHINNDESFGMWKIYVKDSKGIVIQSTYRVIRELLPNDIYIGKVNYIDYKLQPFTEGDLFAPIIHKRRSFAYENELRAVKFSLNQLDLEVERNLLLEPNRDGILVPINVNKLIDTIYVAPSSEEWFYNLVLEISKRFDLEIPVRKSPLDEKPFF